jgi:hypothetical protein
MCSVVVLKINSAILITLKVWPLELIANLQILQSLQSLKTAIVELLSNGKNHGITCTLFVVTTFKLRTVTTDGWPLNLACRPTWSAHLKKWLWHQPLSTSTLTCHLPWELQPRMNMEKGLSKKSNFYS